LSCLFDRLPELWMTRTVVLVVDDAQKNNLKDSPSNVVNERFECQSILELHLKYKTRDHGPLLAKVIVRSPGSISTIVLVDENKISPICRKMGA